MTAATLTGDGAASPDLEWTVPGWRVGLARAHVPAVGFGVLLAVLAVVAPEKLVDADRWPVAVIPAGLVGMPILAGILGGRRRALWVEGGLVRVLARDQDVDPRRLVATADRLDGARRRWRDAFVTLLLGQRVIRQRDERTPLWVPVAWMSRDELDDFLDEARRVSPRITSS